MLHNLYVNCILLLCLILSFGKLCYTDGNSKPKPKPTPYQDWDYLVFSQRWPITSCTEWEEEKADNTCNLPQDKTIWTVHGVWPTKTGEEGPFFCPSAIHFDPGQLDPIMDDLNTYWINVEANTKPYSFWKHEWAKHGTCASTLPELDSVRNYFIKGLEWNKEYKLSDILDKSKIVPNNVGYTIDQIYNAVKSFTKTDPMIQCVVDSQSEESMISEIRICFNKTLDLIDCDQSNPVNRNKLGMITNCSSKKPVMYLQEPPPNQSPGEIDYIDDTFREHLQEQFYYMSLYRFIKFLIWFTT